MKENVLEWQQDYLEVHAGFPNVGDRLIYWFCMARKPVLMPMHTTCAFNCSYLATSKMDFHTTMVLQQIRKGRSWFFLDAKEASQGDPQDSPAWSSSARCFFKQCQNAHYTNGVFDQIIKEKKEKALKKLSTAKHNGSHECNQQNKPWHCDGYRTHSMIAIVMTTIIAVIDMIAIVTMITWSHSWQASSLQQKL